MIRAVEYGAWDDDGIGAHCAQCEDRFAGVEIDHARTVDSLLRRLERSLGQITLESADGLYGTLHIVRSPAVHGFVEIVED